MEQATLDVSGLTKRFGALTAIDALSFTVEPGQVCGFLGPNGAGKTTTLRCMLGLITPTAGTATIGGQRYVDLADPVVTVGALLDASSFHPGRTARNHLRVLCAAAGLPDTRADEVLVATGMEDAADRRVGGYSTGMRQRLGLAAALLGDPQVLILDEPATGLDPAGINWLRELLRHLAHDQGRTVLVSSHLLSEVEQTVDHVVIISQGKLIRRGSLDDIVGHAIAGVRVRTPHLEKLSRLLTSLGVAFDLADGGVIAHGIEPGALGHLAFTNAIELSELSAVRSDLEAVFLELTSAVDEPKAAA